MIAIALLALTLVGLLAGCGASNTTTQQVIDTFREQTGRHLVREARSSGGYWDTLSLDDPDPGYEWGSWTLYVALDRAKAEAILLRGSGGRRLEPDEQGIYWDREDYGNGAFWIVVKRYAANVYLSYIGDTTRDGSMDASFDRVDTALSALG